MIKKLSNSYSPSAKEEEVREIIIKELSDFYSDIRVDDLGNLIIHKPGKKKCIALTSPMDEVSFIITHIKNDKNLIGTSVCDVKSKTLQNITVIDKNRQKYILSKLPNNIDEYVKISNIEFSNFNTCKANCLDNEFVSESFIYNENFNENDGFYIGKAMERSVCCSILCDIARNVANSLYEYYFVFSAQNYCDKKGSMTATYNLKIDELYNICCIDTDTEDVLIEKGSVLVLRDKMLISNSDLVAKFEDKQPMQKIISSNLICEGGYYQRQSTTQKIISVGIPVNFLGCFNEVVSKKDIYTLKNNLMEIVLP